MFLKAMVLRSELWSWGGSMLGRSPETCMLSQLDTSLSSYILQGRVTYYLKVVLAAWLLKPSSSLSSRLCPYQSSSPGDYLQDLHPKKNISPLQRIFTYGDVHPGPHGKPLEVAASRRRKMDVSMKLPNSLHCAL